MSNFRLLLPRLLVVLLTLTAATSGRAANYNWTTISGGNWSTGWDLNPAYPKVTGDTGTISDAGWAAAQSAINVDVTDISGGNLTINDVGSSIGFNPSANNSATFDSITFNRDTAGGGQGKLTIASGKTLTVNSFSASGWVQGWSNGGTLSVQPDVSGVATFGLAGEN